MKINSFQEDRPDENINYNRNQDAICSIALNCYNAEMWPYVCECNVLSVF